MSGTGHPRSAPRMGLHGHLTSIDVDSGWAWTSSDGGSRKALDQLVEPCCVFRMTLARCRRASALIPQRNDVEKAAEAGPSFDGSIQQFKTLMWRSGQMQDHVEPQNSHSQAQARITAPSIPGAHSDDDGGGVVEVRGTDVDQQDEDVRHHEDGEESEKVAQ